MQIESLKVFCDLAETESFTKAAQINQITQSAVSQQVSALERTFKSLLIERSKKKFRLTREGQILYDYAKQLINIYEQFCGIPAEPETPAENPDEVTVQEMKKALDDPALGIRVIDVREPDEFEIAHIEGVPQIPLSVLNQRFTELDPNQQLYIHCKSGVRSMKALNFLREQGYKYVKSVKGGISAWADEIDPSIPKY